MNSFGLVSTRKEQALAMNMPSSPHYWPIPLVPSSPPPPGTTVTDHWPPGRAPSCVSHQEGGPLARSGWPGQLGAGHLEASPWGGVCGRCSPYTLTSHDAEGPRRSLGPGNMENQGQRPGQPVGRREGLGSQILLPTDVSSLPLTAPRRFILCPASSGPSGERQFRVRSEVTTHPSLP